VRHRAIGTKEPVSDAAPPITLYDLQSLLVDVVTLQQKHDALLHSLSAKVETMEHRVEEPIKSKANTQPSNVFHEVQGMDGPVRDGFLLKYHDVLAKLDLETMMTEILDEFDLFRQHQGKKIEAVEADISRMTQCLLSETDLLEQARTEHKHLRQEIHVLQETQQEQDRIMAQICGLQSLARQDQALTQMYAHDNMQIRGHTKNVVKKISATEECIAHTEDMAEALKSYQAATEPAVQCTQHGRSVIVESVQNGGPQDSEFTEQVQQALLRLYELAPVTAKRHESAEANEHLPKEKRFDASFASPCGSRPAMWKTLYQPEPLR
jgi:predicted ribosome quality control (RQC) complex YloA/Tae2 family protein